MFIRCSNHAYFVVATRHMGKKQGREVSCREYYCYLFQIRDEVNNILLQAGRLFQQFIVDMYVKIESMRLDFFRNNQNVIRVDLYKGILDSLHLGENQGSKVGHPIILPPFLLEGLDICVEDI